LAFIDGWLESERPLLGVCLGAQLLAEAAGGAVVRSQPRELGWYDVELTDAGKADPVLGFRAPRFSAFEWHSYEARPPEGAAGHAPGWRRTAACAGSRRSPAARSAGS